jgi:predicted nucleic acid-binding protein
MSDRVFVDTSAYYAFADGTETQHAAALAAAHRFNRGGVEFYTTNFIAAEMYALILTRVNRATALRVLDRLYTSRTRIVRATEGDETRARDVLRHHQDKDYSYVDAISFAVMQRLHIRLAWTYDQHFAQFGFTQAG